MIDLQNGMVKIADDLRICPNYTFGDFKKSRYYNNQDGVRVIYLDGQQVIDNRKYIVSLFFRDEMIYMLSLFCCDKEFAEEDEKARKQMHDEILSQLGVKHNSDFSWGKISSTYDARSNCSSINIIYLKA